MVAQRHHCSRCGTNWLSERDPLQAGTSEWICLYLASSILTPVSTLHPGDESPTCLPPIEAVVSQPATSDDPILHRLI